MGSWIGFLRPGWTWTRIRHTGTWVRTWARVGHTGTRVRWWTRVGHTGTRATGDSDQSRTQSSPASHHDHFATELRTCGCGTRGLVARLRLLRITLAMLVGKTSPTALHAPRAATDAASRPPAPLAPLTTLQTA